MGSIAVICSFTHADITAWEASNGNTKNILDFVISETVDLGSFQTSESKIGILTGFVSDCIGSSHHIFEIRKFLSFELIHNIHLSEFV
ncbi:hypothetical protein X975_01981, partial [Stegodyphus mimosarum]